MTKTRSQVQSTIRNNVRKTSDASPKRTQSVCEVEEEVNVRLDQDESSDCNHASATSVGSLPSPTDSSFPPTASTPSLTHCDLTTLVATLCNRISNLESKIDDLILSKVSGKADLKNSTTQHVTSVHTQTDPEHPATIRPQKTFADVVKSSTPSLCAKALEPISVKRCPQAFNSNQSKACDVSNTKNVTSNDVKNGSRKGNVNEKKKNHIKISEQRDQLPSILILHDSVLDGVDAERLGASYGLKVVSKKTATIKSIKSTFEEASHSSSFDAVLIHSGLNDLKTRASKEASSTLVSSIKEISVSHPDTRFVISKVAPCKQEDLRAKRELFNAHTFAAFHRNEKVSFISHENLSLSRSTMRDAVHPSVRGSSILAGNIGRHLHSIFWFRPRRQHHRRPQRSPWHDQWQPWWGHQQRPPVFVSHPPSHFPVW